MTEAPFSLEKQWEDIARQAREQCLSQLEAQDFPEEKKAFGRAILCHGTKSLQFDQAANLLLFFFKEEVENQDKGEALKH